MLNAERAGLKPACIKEVADHRVEPVGGVLVDVWTAILAIGGSAALNRWHGKLTVLYVVLGCGLAGAGLQLTVV